MENNYNFIINEGINNLSNQFYYNPNQINMSDMIQEVAKSVPKNIINIFIFAILLLLIYNYVVPIYGRYFNYSNEISHMLFVGGLSLTIFGVINLIYYLFPELILYYSIIFGIIIISLICMIGGIIWLSKHKRRK